MPESPPFGTTSNRLLSRLSREDFGRLAPHLEAADLPVRHWLEIRNRRIEYVYFLESGFASVVANGSKDRSIEVGLIEREGMTGLAVLMGTDRTPYDTNIQLGGKGWRLDHPRLTKATPIAARAMPANAGKARVSPKAKYPPRAASGGVR